MKKLINNLVQIFTSAMTIGRVAIQSVKKGIHPEPDQIALTEYPFIAFDDGGQMVEEVKSDNAQRRIFTVIIEIGVYSLNVQDALDQILDVIDQCKAEIEREDNRALLYDSHIWAVNVTTFSWNKENKFFRGAQIMCKFYELEPRFSDY